MTTSTVHLRLEYVIRDAGADPFVSGYEELLTFPIAHADRYTGTKQMHPPGVGNVQTILGLAKVEFGAEVRSYVLFRLRDLHTFDHEIDESLAVVSAQVKVTWPPAAENELPFTLVYATNPQLEKVLDSIPVDPGTLNWEFLLKRTGDSPANARYFLHRVVKGFAGEDALEECDKLKLVWDDVLVTTPKNKRAIREARRAYDLYPCPPAEA